MMRKNFSLNSLGLTLGFFIAAIALGAFGATFISVSVQTSSLEEFSKTWPEAKALITGLDIVEKEGRQEPLIHYTFWVKEKEYKSDRVFLASGKLEEIKKSGDALAFKYTDAKGHVIEKQFFKGTETAVYHNPYHPGDCVLVRAVLRDMRPYFFWGCALILVALVLLVKSFYDE